MLPNMPDRASLGEGGVRRAEKPNEDIISAVVRAGEALFFGGRWDFEVRRRELYARGQSKGVAADKKDGRRAG